MRSRIRIAAQKLIDTYGTRCPYALADFLGIEVFEFPFKNIRGLIVNLDGRRAIGLKNSLDPTTKKTIVAHEIGHHQLHPAKMGYFFIREHTCFSCNKIEQEANEFAAAVLLDRPPEPGETTKAYAARMDVSADLLSNINFIGGALL